MISMNAISNAGGAARYYTEQARIEYYANEVVPSIWGGRGLEVAGFQGSVSAEDLTKILSGQVHERLEGELSGEATEKILGRTVIDKQTGERVKEHRAGWDLTFAPPKSVSIESEVFGRQGVRDAHEAAVAAAMGYFEENAAQTRYQHQLVFTGNLVYASFAHATSRAGDPQTHTHVLVANVTYLDGKAYSLSNEQLLKQRTTADAVYRNELASGLSRQGYALDFDGRGNFEIAGYDRAQLEEFSKRSAQIDAALQERGSSIETASYASRQIAVLSTREDKAEGHSENAVAHRERWQAEAQLLGIEPVRPFELDLRQGVRAAELIASAADSLAEREQEFSKRDLVKEAMLQSAGRVASGELLAEIGAQVVSGALVEREANWSGARFTTPGAIAAEHWADQQLLEGRDAHAAVMTELEFVRAQVSFEMRKGFELTGEQAQAARQILTGADQFMGVQGAAGTGKTTMLEFVREAAQARGWTVAGMSNGAAQATKLEADGGIESSTVASFLAKHQGAQAQQQELANGSSPVGQARLLYINDEASMSGQREFNGVIRASLDTGARAVFLGDKAQHQSVAAGSAFERAQDTMRVAWLTQINRQTTEAAKSPVRSIVAGDHAEAIRKTAREYGAAQGTAAQKWEEIAERGGGVLTRSQVALKRDEVRAARGVDNQAAIEAIARDYVGLSPAERERTAVITGTNVDRQALNSAIRGRLVEIGDVAEGGVAKDGVLVQTLQRKDLTRAQAAQASSYELGDVLKESTGARRAGQARERYLTVEVVDAQANTVTVRSGDPGDPVRVLGGRELGALTAYVAAQREIAVGDRVAFLENSRAAGVQNGDLGTVLQVNAQGMTVRVQGQDVQGQERAVAFAEYRQIDHGYVMTSHKSQGQTADRTLIHHNTEGGMHGQREAYVNVTRARLSTTTYTQDRERAAEQAQRAVNKTQAVGRSRGEDRAVEVVGEGRRGTKRTPRRRRTAEPRQEAVAGRLNGHSEGRAEVLAVDELRFEPVSYADVTWKPGQRLDVVADLVAQRVPEKERVGQEMVEAVMVEARQAASQIVAERGVMAEARQEAQRISAEWVNDKAHEKAADVKLAQEALQREQEAKAQHEEPQKEINPERKIDRGWTLGM